MKKTTCSIYFSPSYPIFGYNSFTWIRGVCFVSFTGSYQKEWSELWEKFKSGAISDLRKDFEKEQRAKIEKIEAELLVAVDSFFSKKRKILEDRLKKEKEKCFEPNEGQLFDLIYKFLPDDCVKISGGGKNTIYEILSKPKKLK